MKLSSLFLILPFLLPFIRINFNVNGLENISDCNQFLSVVLLNTTIEYQFTNNISCSNYSDFPMIGDSNSSNFFQGTIDGNGFTLSDITINSTSTSIYIAIFRNTESATFKNLNLQVKFIRKKKKN